MGGLMIHVESLIQAQKILVVSFATRPRAFILNDRNIFYTPRGGTTAEPNAPGAFLFWGGSLAPDLQFSLGQPNTRLVLRVRILPP